METAAVTKPHLVRKLLGIETSGSLNILFTDKTGTLTQGRLNVSEFISGDGNNYDDFEETLEKLSDILANPKIDLHRQSSFFDNFINQMMAEKV